MTLIYTDLMGPDTATGVSLELNWHAFAGAYQLE